MKGAPPGKKLKLGAYVMQRLACDAHLRLHSPWAGGSLGPADDTSVRPGSVPSLPSPGTQLPLHARQHWMSMNFKKFPPEKSSGMVRD